MHLKVLFRDERLHLVRARNLIVASWFGAPIVEHLPHLSRASKGIPPHVTVNLVLGGVPLFSEEVRRGLRKIAAENPNRLGLAQVVKMRGFAGATVRAFLSTLMTKEGVRVFGSEDAAVPWITERLATSDEVWTSAQVMASVQQAHSLTHPS